MLKRIKRNFGHLEGGTNPPDNLPDITKAITQTLSRLMGWFDPAQEWRDINVDSEGRILISTAQLQAQIINETQVTVSNPEVLILAENVERHGFFMENTGSVPYTISFKIGGTATSNFKLLPSEFIQSDDYTGAIYGLTVALSFGLADVLEF